MAAILKATFCMKKDQSRIPYRSFVRRECPWILPKIWASKESDGIFLTGVGEELPCDDRKSYTKISFRHI